MIVYEVNLEVDTAVATAYRAWLERHVEQMLQLPGFLDARILEVLDPAPASARIELCVQYTLPDQAALDAYLDGHARRMRDEGIARFGERVRARRRVLRG